MVVMVGLHSMDKVEHAVFKLFIRPRLYTHQEEAYQHQREKMKKKEVNGRNGAED